MPPQVTTALGLALRAMAGVVGRMPFRWLWWLGGPLAWACGRVRRSHVEAALARAGVGSAEARAARMYRSLATGVMELLWLAGGKRKALGSVVMVDPASEALLKGALGADRGMVVAASHTGNWELLACAFAQRVSLSVVLKRVSIRGFDSFMRAVRARYDVALLEGDGALARARGLVRRGGVVAVLADQVPPRASHGAWVPFLGERALSGRTAAALSANTGAPLLVTASRRKDDGSHVIHVLSVKWPPLQDHHAWALQATRESTDELARFVQSYPDQWLWLHRRWRQPDAP